eukprot:TRINITY_DN470_c0_g1_i2.p1 TRINITY_DN470_c0_g1~~TRINITY_DN470_c0_g1_i2.p1  ORF type:complete len:172 (-),score=31.34 TRINITY_DN470_c0_g1_i2:81-596(-)
MSLPSDYAGHGYGMQQLPAAYEHLAAGLNAGLNTGINTGLGLVGGAVAAAYQAHHDEAARMLYEQSVALNHSPELDASDSRRSRESGKDTLEERRRKNRESASLSRKRKKEYVGNLEQQATVLTTEKLELQLRVAKLTNQLWEQSLKIEELEKTIQELRMDRARDKDYSHE